jgi:hypothetical protein
MSCMASRAMNIAGTRANMSRDGAGDVFLDAFKKTFMQCHVS